MIELPNTQKDLYKYLTDHLKYVPIDLQIETFAEDLEHLLIDIREIENNNIERRLIMKHITRNDDLDPGKTYWCRNKRSKRVTIEECKQDRGHKFVGNRIWAMDSNNQALERWDIVGPIPKTSPIDFDLYMNSNE